MKTTMFEVFNDGVVMVLAAYPRTPVPGIGEGTVLEVYVADPAKDTADFETALAAAGKVLSDPGSWPMTKRTRPEFGHLMSVTVTNRATLFDAHWERVRREHAPSLG